MHKHASQATDAPIDVGRYGASGRSTWLDIDWRRYLHKVDLDGRQVNYVRYGSPDSPTVVLIHGLAGCWQNWIENVEPLGRDFDVIALDLPGFGESELPAGDVSIAGYARTVVGLLDALGLERAKLIGNSMGGQIAVQTAIDFPERTGSMILVSPAGYSTCSTPPILQRGAYALGEILPRVLAHRPALISRPRLRKIALAGVVAHPEKLSAEAAFELMGGDGKIGFAAAAKAILAHDFRERLVDVKCPTLIIWGQDDRLITSRDAERFASRIVGSRKIVLRDTGHVAMMERPDWFNAIAKEFFLQA